MSRPFVRHIITDDSALGGMEIKRSWRVEQGTSDVDSGSNFYRVLGQGNRRTFTTSVWVKKCDTPGNIGDDQYAIFSSGGGGSGSSSLNLYFYNNDRLQYGGGISGSSSFQLYTDRIFRDTCNWYHIVASVDSTQATASNRVKLYVNGVQQTNLQTATYPSQNYEMYHNNGIRHRIGSNSRWQNMAQTYGNFNGYMAEMHFIDGQQLTPDSFGYTDTMTGIWRPKRFIPTGPNNGVTWSSSTQFDANVFDGDHTDNFLAQVSNGYYTATTSPFTIKQSLAVITGNGYHWGAKLNGSTEVTTGTLSSSMGVADRSIVNFDLSSVTLPLDVTNLQIKAGTGSSGSTYIYGIVVDGVILIDGDVSNIGLNGFWLDFRDKSSTTTLGYDYSGNGNHFTPDEISVSGWEGNDSFIDTPTNNFPMLNIEAIYKVHNNTSDVYNGALKYNCHYDNQGSVPASMAFPTSGKWYFEVKLLTSNSNATFGIVPALWSQDHNSVQETGARMYAAYGQYFVNGNATSGLNGWGTSDTVAAALDMDEKTLTFYKNNSVEIKLALESGYENVPYLPILTGGTNGGSVNLGINFGANESWTYTPPAGFKSLCTNNFPPIAFSPIYKPQAHFDTLLYTGNGTTGQSITGLAFKPDLVWIKSRSFSNNHHLFDSIRGVDKILRPSSDGQETTVTGVMSSFDPITVKEASGNNATNDDGATFAAWCWKAGGTAVTNNDGTITTSVSVNEEAGFSIVSYSGTGSAGTIGHGLGKVPKWIITKRRTGTEDWKVYHSELDGGKFLKLNSTQAQTSNSDVYPNTAPTSSVYSLGNHASVNGSGDTYIAYCWAEIPGYSKFSSYVGDGSSDGPSIFVGFSPAWLLLKSAGSTNNWVLMDVKRNGYTSGGAPSEGNFVNFKTLCTNLTNGEDASGGTTNDINSNGFKMRGSSDRNISGQKHIYIAFAEAPDSTAFHTEPNAR